jgi:acetyl esterase/lipase
MLYSISFCTGAVAADINESEDVIQLWSKQTGINRPTVKETVLPDRGDGNVRVTDIDTPSMRYFPASGNSQPTPALILCPGGGYKYLVVSKMDEIAKWLNGHGISAFVLKYRTPKKRMEAFSDLQRAIRIVRSRASEWNVDPNRIGVMGSSAGGHLAARASTGFDIKTYQAVDGIDSVSCRTDFTVLLYPAYMNKGEVLNQEFTVSRKLAPTLIISAQNDKNHFKGSAVYAKALNDCGASIRVHFFKSGGHGFGLRPKIYPLSTWPDLCLQWFRDMDISAGKAEPTINPER